MWYYDTFAVECEGPAVLGTKPGEGRLVVLVGAGWEAPGRRERTGEAAAADGGDIYLQDTAANNVRLVGLIWSYFCCVWTKSSCRIMKVRSWTNVVARPSRCVFKGAKRLNLKHFTLTCSVYAKGLYAVEKKLLYSLLIAYSNTTLQQKLMSFIPFLKHQTVYYVSYWSLIMNWNFFFILKDYS